MANTHAIPDTMSEIQALFQDLLPACITAGGTPSVPGSGLVLAAFATQGFVVDGEQSVYVDQPAISVTLTGSAGNFWLALHRDVSSAVAGWTRRSGSCYLWQTNATQPANPAGALVFCQVVVTGVNITAVTPIAGARNPMSTQMSSAVAITGGNVAGLSSLAVTGDTSLTGNLGVQGASSDFVAQNLFYLKASQHGIQITPTDNNTGPGGAIVFLNATSVAVGSIGTNATATAYNTSSDVRLKHATCALTGALDVVAALRPVKFRWNADDSVGHGFLAHELQATIPDAVSGLPDAVNDDGSVRPQQVDHSKLVPWLTAALQELSQQVAALVGVAQDAHEQTAALQARVQSLEEQLGL